MTFATNAKATVGVDLQRADQFDDASDGWWTAKPISV